MTVESLITQAIESGAYAPLLGLLAIVLSWLLSKWRHQQPIGEQLKHAGTILLQALPYALGAGGLAAVGGMTPTHVAGVFVGVLLTKAGFTLPTPAKPTDAAKRSTLGSIVLVTLVPLFLNACELVAKYAKKAGNIADVVLKWVQIIRGTIPVMGLSEETEKDIMVVVGEAEVIVEEFRELSRVPEAFKDGRLDEVEERLNKVYEKLYGQALRLGILNEASRAAQGPEEGEQVGEPEELRQLLRDMHGDDRSHLYLTGVTGA